MTTNHHQNGEHSAAEEMPTIFVWCQLAAFAGMLLVVGGEFFHQEWAAPIGAVLLIGAGVVAIANGWYTGSKPPPETRADINLRVARGLVGSVIELPAGPVTVVDDSTSGDRRRRSVTAVDTAGRAGLLFVELDPKGRLIAAALPGSTQWIPTQTRT